MKGESIIELLIQTNNISQFLSKLLKYIQTEIDTQMRQITDDDSIYIGCKNFYAYILTNDIPSFECIEKAFDVILNLDIDIELYQEKWDVGVANLRMLIEWILETFTGDMVLLSDTSELIALRQRGEVIRKSIL